MLVVKGEQSQTKGSDGHIQYDVIQAVNLDAGVSVGAVEGYTHIASHLTPNAFEATPCCHDAV